MLDAINTCRMPVIMIPLKQRWWTVHEVWLYVISGTSVYTYSFLEKMVKGLMCLGAMLLYSTRFLWFQLQGLQCSIQTLQTEKVTSQTLWRGHHFFAFLNQRWKVNKKSFWEPFRVPPVSPILPSLFWWQTFPTLLSAAPCIPRSLSWGRSYCAIAKGVNQGGLIRPPPLAGALCLVLSAQ